MGRRSTWARRNPEEYLAAWRRWYHKNAAKKIAWQQRRRQELREWWDELKRTKQCVRCGESHPACLHFHHRDPRSKDLELSICVSHGWSKVRILSEAAKCDVLCANCHFKHHWEDRRSSREVPDGVGTVDLLGCAK